MLLSPSATQSTHLPIQAGPAKPRSAAISSTTAVRSVAESDIDDLEVGDVTPSPSLKSVEHFEPWLAGVEPHASPTQSPDLAGHEDAQSIPESLDMLRIDSNPQSTPIIPVVWGPHNKPNVDKVSSARDGRRFEEKKGHSSNEGSSSGAETVKPSHLGRADIIHASDFEKHQPSSARHSGPASDELVESIFDRQRRTDELRRVLRAEHAEHQRQIRQMCRASLVKREALMLLLVLFLLIPLVLCIVLGSLPFPRWIHFSLAASRFILVLAYLAGVLAIFIILEEVALITDYAVQFATGWNFACGTTRPPLWRWSKRITLCLVATAFIGGPNLFPRAAKAGMWPRLCGGGNGWLAVEMSGGHAVVSLKDGDNWHKQFTFHINSTNRHSNTFQLLDYASGSRVLPALSVVDYATNSGEFAGRCEHDNGVLCPTALNLTGNIHDVDSRLTFKVTTNDTQNTLSRAYDKTWSFEDAPVLDLRAIPSEFANGMVDLKHAPVILRTSLHRCPRMKVCIPRQSVVQIDNGMEVLGPKVLVPLGWIVMRAQEWGEKCAGRSLSPYTIS